MKNKTSQVKLETELKDFLIDYKEKFKLNSISDAIKIILLENENLKKNLLRR